MAACGLLLAPGQLRSRNELFTAAASTAAAPCLRVQNRRAAPHSSSCATTCSLTQQPGSRRCFSSAHSRPHSAHRTRQLQQAAGPDATLPVVRFRKFMPHHAGRPGIALAAQQLAIRCGVELVYRQHHVPCRTIIVTAASVLCRSAQRKSLRQPSTHMTVSQLPLFDLHIHVVLHVETMHTCSL